MHNLLSISQLSDNGYDIIFNQNSYRAVSQKDGTILFFGKRKNNIYKIDLSDLKTHNVKCILSVSDEQWVCVVPQNFSSHLSRFFSQDFLDSRHD